MPAVSGTLTQDDLDGRSEAYLKFLRDAGLGNFEQLVGTQALVGVKSSKAATRVLQMRHRLIDIKSRVERARQGLERGDENPASAGGVRERMSDHALRQ